MLDLTIFDQVNAATETKALTVEDAQTALLCEALEYMAKQQPRDTNETRKAHDIFNAEIARQMYNAEKPLAVYQELLQMYVLKVNAARQNPDGYKIIKDGDTTKQSAGEDAEQRCDFFLTFTRDLSRSLVTNAFFNAQNSIKSAPEFKRNGANDAAINEALNVVYCQQLMTLEERAEYAGSNPTYAEETVWLDAATELIEGDSGFRKVYESMYNAQFCSAFFKRGEFNQWNVGAMQDSETGEYINAVTVVQRIEQLIAQRKARPVRESVSKLVSEMDGLLAGFEPNAISGDA